MKIIKNKKRIILDSLVKNYSANFLEGKYLQDEMPLLDAMSSIKSNKIFDEKINLDNVIVVACQHLLIPQVNLFQKFINLGILPGNIYILPKAYSYNAKVSDDLKKIGCTVLDSANNFNIHTDFDVFHAQQVKIIAQIFQENISQLSKILILDDGGLLIKTLNNDSDYLKKYKNQTFAVEQTNGGKNILVQDNLQFLTTSVASSREKLEIETDYIIRLAIERIFEYFKINNIRKDANILILGKGTIGSCLHDSLSNEYQVSIYDIKDGKNNLLLRNFDVIIGATGVNSISEKELSLLKEDVYLISVSSSDREFPASFLRKENPTKNIHDNFYSEKFRIYLANGGFPITFKGNEFECTPLEMDVTMMKLFEYICNHVLGKKDYENSINRLQKKNLLV